MVLDVSVSQIHAYMHAYIHTYVPTHLNTDVYILAPRYVHVTHEDMQIALAATHPEPRAARMLNLEVKTRRLRPQESGLRSTSGSNELGQGCRMIYAGVPSLVWGWRTAMSQLSGF